MSGVITVTAVIMRLSYWDSGILASQEWQDGSTVSCVTRTEESDETF